VLTKLASLEESLTFQLGSPRSFPLEHNTRDVVGFGIPTSHELERVGDSNV
jgi:hypothetical protein